MDKMFRIRFSKELRVSSMTGVLVVLLALQGSILTASAQRVLSLDSCRQMALRNNKQLGISKLKQDVAANVRKAART